jgi:SAM-dependent methyltransferase
MAKRVFYLRCFTMLVTLFFIGTSIHGFPAEDHTGEGTSYGEHGIHTYAKMKHGPDGNLFLDPYFIPYLLNLHGEVLLDAGCGAGPWSIFAAKNGAFVHGIDIQEGMIEKAQKAAVDEQVGSHTDFIVGDVAHLPYPDNFFDKALSINVGCNLPCLKPHFDELSRVLKSGGIAIITAPSSFDVVFTDGKRGSGEVTSSIDLLLTNDQESFPNIIQGLDEVYRATFAKRQNTWSLVYDETDLGSGEEIWRKIPMMAVPNYYHSVDEYITLISSADFFIKQIHRPHFNDEHARQDYNNNQRHMLGKEYVANSPFVILVIQKL